MALPHTAGSPTHFRPPLRRRCQHGGLPTCTDDTNERARPASVTLLLILRRGKVEEFSLSPSASPATHGRKGSKKSHMKAKRNTRRTRTIHSIGTYPNVHFVSRPRETGPPPGKKKKTIGNEKHSVTILWFPISRKITVFLSNTHLTRATCWYVHISPNTAVYTPRTAERIYYGRLSTAPRAIHCPHLSVVCYFPGLQTNTAESFDHNLHEHVYVTLGGV